MSNTTTTKGRVIIITLLILLSGISSRVFSQIPRHILITVPHADNAVSFIYDASQGNKALSGHNHEPIYAHTGVRLSDGTMKYMNSKPGAPMTYIGDNKWRIDMPDGKIGRAHV